jgi:predicted DNA-binding transcriptional regulator YafY
MYKAVAGDNLEFDGSVKVYIPSATFTPVFDHSAQRVLTALSEGFGEGIGSEHQSLVRCEFPVALSLPRTDVLAPMTRAIHRGKAVRLKYHSTTSGASVREVVPLALVNSGTRWHIRVYDRKQSAFRDFVLTRMSSPEVLEDSVVRAEEKAENDLQWSRIIELELVPHPGHRRPEVVKLDYNMPDGVLRVRVRAASAGYMLQRWYVDCSPDHSMRGPEYALWLRDPLALYGSETALLAPGYRDPKEVTTTGRAVSSSKD